MVGTEATWERTDPQTSGQILFSLWEPLREPFPIFRDEMSWTFWLEIKEFFSVIVIARTLEIDAVQQNGTFRKV